MSDTFSKQSWWRCNEPYMFVVAIHNNREHGDCLAINCTKAYFVGYPDKQLEIHVGYKYDSKICRVLKASDWTIGFFPKKGV